MTTRAKRSVAVKPPVSTISKPTRTKASSSSTKDSKAGDKENVPLIAAASPPVLASSKTAAGPLPIWKAGPLAEMAKLFNESQLRSHAHLKNAIALRKIQDKVLAGEADKFTEMGKDGLPLTPEERENLFDKAFIHHLNKILPVRKAEICVERIVSLVSEFANYSLKKDGKNNEKAAPVLTENEMNIDADEDEDLSDEEARSVRFLEKLLKYLLRGCEAKDKNVRYRCLQLIAKVIDSLTHIDDDLWGSLEKKLIDRLYDKESPIRVQAVISLARFQAAEEEGDEDETVISRFIHVLARDPSADVRRTILLNIEPTKLSVPTILERARDADASVRKTVYRHSMKSILWTALPLEKRHELLRSGLQERDSSVRKVCLDMLNSWISSCEDILEFLENLNVLDSAVPEIALKAYFEGFSGAKIEFGFAIDDAFWDELRVESSFFLRVYCEYLDSKKSEELEAILPEISRVCTIIQKYQNILSSIDEDDEDYQVNTEFIVSQLLMMAKIFDYTDEVGRGAIFNLLREALQSPDTPDIHIDKIIDILKITSVNEHDFSRIIIEIITDIRAPDGEMLLSAASTSIHQKDDNETLARCLLIAKHMLMNINIKLSENAVLHGLLTELIVPALVVSNPLIQELAVSCLGLFSLLDKKVARDNLQFFTTTITKGYRELKLLAVQIAFDLIMQFGVDLFTDEESGLDLVKCIKGCILDDDQETQTVLVHGFSKLLLLKVIRDPAVLQMLIIMYFHPSDNISMRQCLSYFLYVYSYSCAANQLSIQKIFLPTLTELCKIFKRLGSDSGMISPLAMGHQMLDWMDADRLIRRPEDDLASEETTDQADIGIALCMHCVDDKSTPAVIKVCCQLLPKLHITKEGSDIVKIKKLVYIVGKLSKNIGDKAMLSSLKRFAKKLVDLDDDASEPLRNEDIEEYENLIVQAFQNLSVSTDSEDDGESGDDQPKTHSAETSSPEAPTRSRRPVRKSKIAAQTKLKAEIDDMLESD